MTVKEFLEQRKMYFKNQHRRLIFIHRRTKSKRIKEKVEHKIQVAARIIETYENIIEDLGEPNAGIQN
ncbi:hypothetical protein [Evansella clarkii]|uniref:hypothetical protein n=1 Tax=Evansella clarkii TaxID=79879 RepID=UPI00099814F2|nr:hypothetical protein [Evansella clarkii]